MNAWESSLKSWINLTGNEESNRRVTFSKKVRNVQHKKGSVAPFIEHSYVHTGVIVTCTQGSPIQSYGYTVIGSLKLFERATDMISSKTGSEYTGRPCMVTIRFVSSSSRVWRVLVSSLSREWLSLFRWLPDSFSLLVSLNLWLPIDLLTSNSTFVVGVSCDTTLQLWEVANYCVPCSHYWDCSGCWYDRPC